MKRAPTTKTSVNLKHFVAWTRPTGRQLLCETVAVAVIFLVYHNLLANAPESQTVSDWLRTVSFVSFWLFLGVGIYIFYWLSRNFVSEIGDDLARLRSKRRAKNRWRPLEFSIENSLFRLCIAVVTMYYTIFLLRVVLPWTERAYQQPSLALLAALICPVFCVHVYAILLRLLLIRRSLLARYI